MHHNSLLIDPLFLRTQAGVGQPPVKGFSYHHRTDQIYNSPGVEALVHLESARLEVVEVAEVAEPGSEAQVPQVRLVLRELR